MAELKQFKVLVFDVYATLIDWESGILHALVLLLKNNPTAAVSAKQLLETYHKHESQIQQDHPSMLYHEILTKAHPRIASDLNLSTPSRKENEAFGQSIGRWPAFPDTVEALRCLSKHFKLVVLSNVDRNSFSTTNAGPLNGFPFDAILTAQDIGSYKPDPKNFEYMLKYVKDTWGIEKGQVLLTAQSQRGDIVPGRELGIKGSWIARTPSVMGNIGGVEPCFDWHFRTLADMATAVERA